MDIVSKTINSLEFDKVLEKVSDFAKIKQSRELCLNARIFDSIADIKLQLQCTSKYRKYRKKCACKLFIRRRIE